MDNDNPLDNNAPPPTACPVPVKLMRKCRWCSTVQSPLKAKPDIEGLLAWNVPLPLLILTYTPSLNPMISPQPLAVKSAITHGCFSAAQPPMFQQNSFKTLWELLSMPHWFLSDSGHSCGIQWNPEESNLAETPAKIIFQGANIPVEWCHSWLVAGMVPGMDKKECNWNAKTGIDY